MSLTPDQRKQARYIIRRYLERAEANRADIGYSQHRLLTCLGLSPDAEFDTDCSGLVIAAFRWADIWMPVTIKDPGGYYYSGAGNTQSILGTNRRRRVPLDRKFFVGDMALFGSSLLLTKHMTICRRNGDTNTAIWTSHGRAAGPEPRRLLYRSDFLGVFRSEALA